MRISFVFLTVSLSLVTILTAQVERTHNISLKNWPAPLYWQAEPVAPGGKMAPEIRTPSPEAATPAGSLVFVAMTPCRVVDTRASQMFSAPFGQPNLTPGPARSFPIQSSTLCSVPSNAEAYSFNVTVVPPGPLGYLTIYPHGQAQPNAVTLDDVLGQIVNNAAIVPAGTVNGSVDIVVNGNTDVVLDINGYYAPATGITLAQGTAASPALSFSGDAGTGIFSSGTGVLNFATGGTNRLTVRADGDLDLAGSVRKGGALFLHNLGNGNLGVGVGALSVNSGLDNTGVGYGALIANTTGNDNTGTGEQALLSNSSGGRNTAGGSNALSANTTGNNNIAVGFQAGINITTTSNNIDIGNSGAGSDAGRIRIGTSGTHTSFFAAGIRGVTPGNNDAVPVIIDSNGQLGSGTSAAASTLTQDYSGTAVARVDLTCPAGSFAVIGSCNAGSTFVIQGPAPNRVWYLTSNGTGLHCEISGAGVVSSTALLRCR